MHTARAGAGPLRRFLESCYGGFLRTEYNTHPPQHSFKDGEIKYWVDWVSRMIPNSGRAFAVNFLFQPYDVSYTSRPLRVITLVRDPIARIAGEFLAFRREVEARGGAGQEARDLSADIVRFADAMMRNNYLVKFFAGIDLCDPVDDKEVDRARDVLARLDVVGRHEDPQSFAAQVLALDVFARDGFAEARAAFAAETASLLQTPGDELAAQLNATSRAQLEERNARDLMLYRWIASGLSNA